jgi:VWFA-related protein
MRWVALLALGVALNADSDPPDARVVQLDVAVSDARGRAMTALGPADFRVTTDDGAPLPVVAARFVAGRPRDDAATFPPIHSREDEIAAAAEPGTRVFAFFLDEYHVDAADAPHVRETIGAVIRDRTAPGDLLLVVKPLDPLLSLRLTRDRAAALDAVASFEGRRGDYQPRNTFERDYIAGDPQRIDGVRNQLAVSALHAMATHLSGLRAVRKALVVVSGGFEPTARRRGDVLPTVEGVIRAANRANVSIYAVEPAALAFGAAAAPSAADGPGLLRRLADETNGRVMAPGVPSSETLGHIVSDLSGYYLLTLEGAADGRFHPIVVRVARPGAQVRTRRGYWAVSSEEIARARLAAAPPPAPPPALPPVRVSRLIRPWFGQARGADGQTRVIFVWEATGPGPGERSRVLPPTRLVLKALGADGSLLFEGVVHASDASDDGPASRAEFDAPPGRLRMQMSIEDAASRVLDTDVRDVVVGPLSEAVAFGTPAVFRARTARAFNALAGDPGATPVASREFSRVERLLIRAPLYAPEGAAVAVTAILANRLGQTMRAIPATRAAGSNLYSVDLPLAGLAAGEYAVLLQAAGQPGDARETVAFRVTP